MQEGKTALVCAVEKYNFSEIDRLLIHKANIETQTEVSQTKPWRMLWTNEGPVHNPCELLSRELLREQGYHSQ